jgi:vesicle coat complex subunit
VIGTLCQNFYIYTYIRIYIYTYIHIYIYIYIYIHVYGRYESVIGTLCENLESLEEPEAKGALIWIIGQYAERIDNSQVSY